MNTTKNTLHCKHSNHQDFSSVSGYKTNKILIHHRHIFAPHLHISRRAPRILHALPTTINEARIEERINKAANLIATSEKLLFYDTVHSNVGIVIWQAIRDIPAEHRYKLIHRLTSGDIRRMWNTAGQRYSASRSAIVSSLGPEYSLWNDLPKDMYDYYNVDDDNDDSIDTNTATEKNEKKEEKKSDVAYFEGKAALPFHTLGMSSFQKAFFFMPPTTYKETANDADHQRLYGRVIHPTQFANRIYPGPMYFSATLGTTVVPSCNELCDMKIEYPENQNMIHGLDPEYLPISSWPKPEGQLKAPFNGAFVDYVRAAGPGVLVGMGMRTSMVGSGVFLVPSPLYFAMAKSEK